ncbi:hypothetical protein FD755_014941 [Muntiacus reevesi]|uniref:EF-hand domain-containing protein n=1 Tax=Muntiacus reevesi TaxID=9886 RepID=A0A5N3XI24_MUNRE|nr:hypothetical protein FD755_014941 [Muntiacus reevesi]
MDLTSGDVWPKTLTKSRTNYHLKQVSFKFIHTIAETDKEGIGTVSSEEFFAIMSVKMSEKDEKEEILKAFKLFDDDDTGSISLNNFKRVAKERGENLTDDELQKMLDEADHDGDAEINKEEFLKVMQKTTVC